MKKLLLLLGVLFLVPMALGFTLELSCPSTSVDPSTEVTCTLHFTEASLEDVVAFSFDTAVADNTNTPPLPISSTLTGDSSVSLTAGTPNVVTGLATSNWAMYTGNIAMLTFIAPASGSATVTVSNVQPTTASGVVDYAFTPVGSSLSAVVTVTEPVVTAGLLGDVDGDNCINIDEVLLAVDGFYTGSVSIENVLSIIDSWYNNGGLC